MAAAPGAQLLTKWPALLSCCSMAASCCSMAALLDTRACRRTAQWRRHNTDQASGTNKGARNPCACLFSQMSACNAAAVQLQDRHQGGGKRQEATTIDGHGTCTWSGTGTDATVAKSCPDVQADAHVHAGDAPRHHAPPYLVAAVVAGGLHPSCCSCLQRCCCLQPPVHSSLQ
jgi:hypothetical protein